MGDVAPAVERAATCGGLADERRLRALSTLGLGARSDPRMETFVERVRRRVGAPVAVVSLVYPDEQVFPGMAGLSEPAATRRSTPLTHSFCQHVVLTARELVVPDVRAHPLLGSSVAPLVPDVVAYAGMPLIDDARNVLGALAAMDPQRRSWTAEDLDHLRELAEACSIDLRLRLSRFTADVERARRDELEGQLRRSSARSQALLEAAQSFNGAVSVEDVRRRVGELVGIAQRPSHVGLVLTDGEGRLTRSTEARLPTGPAADPWWASLELTAHVPSAVAVRERRLVVHEDRASFDVAYDERAGTMLRDIGLHAVVAAPLLGADDDALGALVFGWAGERSFTPSDLLILTTISGYAAHALNRAQRLQHRSAVATQMQQAMLTTLPEIEGLAVAARYVPGDAREQVGGDWYDLVPLLDTVTVDEKPRPRRAGDRAGFALSVGDILGHDVAAATVMGQVRSMLRQASWDHPRQPPSAVLTAFENACADLSVPARGTAVLAHLRPGVSGRWCMTWSNAGHPFPVLLVPGAAPVVLDGHDTLFGFPHAGSRPRCDHRRELPPGSTVVLYTDGLVEGRGLDLDAGTARLLALLGDHRDAAPRLLVDTCIEELAAGASDDTVALAFRVPPDRP